MNATLFYEQNRPQLEQLGYTGDNIQEYMQEIMSSPDFPMPMQFTLPEKPEDWVSFQLPAEFVKKCEQHEDKLMISKYTFAKPELTLYNLKKVNEVLQSHFFSIQQLPVL
jgi:hypothetical protein